MATELFNRIKNFNTPAIQSELAALGLPAFEAEFSGFESVPSGLDRVQPFAEATRDIARNTDGSIDTAARGDIRIETRNPLSAADVTAVGTALDDHDPTVDDPSQADDRQQLDDIASLRVLFDAGIADPTLNLTVKLLLGELGEDV